MNIKTLHEIFRSSKGISTDTRKIEDGTLFFAIRGERFDGNQFATDALEKGASYAVIDDPQLKGDERLIYVENTLKTLQNLARFHRQQFDIPVIAITGSNGKTTTKEIVGTILSKKFKSVITEGNLNNHLGVPFTLLRLNESHEMAIVEMGANKPGDIKELVEIAEPTHGLITNIGAAHIEGFGSLEGVINTKKEMYDYLGQHNGTIFFNTDDSVLRQILPQNANLIGFGLDGLVKGMLTKQDPYVSFHWSTVDYQSPEIDTNLVGQYNCTNFLLALCIGSYFEVEPEIMNEAIKNYIPSNNRSQVTRTERNTLIVDCYNANPTSMMAALESFREMSDPDKLAILGDMLELGDISLTAHQEIVDYVNQHKIPTILVGKEMGKTQSDLLHFESWQALKEEVDLQDISDKVILLKGSRGIRLEELIPLL
jgi:UDP-N-acetylmuramoyl-tripeptide--D-alanyl-D-alanine ligase